MALFELYRREPAGGKWRACREPNPVDAPSVSYDPCRLTGLLLLLMTCFDVRTPMGLDSGTKRVVATVFVVRAPVGVASQLK
jgi:hypothetical protein